MNRLAIFDCDGTLVDSGATITAALKASFERNGIPVPPPSVSRRVIGLSLTEAMAALLPDSDRSEHRRLAEDYKTAFMGLRAAGQVEALPRQPRNPCSLRLPADRGPPSVQAASLHGRSGHGRRGRFAADDHRNR